MTGLETRGQFGACQRFLDRCVRNLVTFLCDRGDAPRSSADLRFRLEESLRCSLFLLLVPIPGFSRKISRQGRLGTTLANSLDPQHLGF